MSSGGGEHSITTGRRATTRDELFSARAQHQLGLISMEFTSSQKVFLDLFDKLMTQESGLWSSKRVEIEWSPKDVPVSSGEHQHQHKSLQQQQHQHNHRRRSSFLGSLCTFNCLKLDSLYDLNSIGMEELEDELVEEFFMYLCIAKLPVDASNLDHVRALKQIFYNITGNEIEILLSSSSNSTTIENKLWLQIGFLGNDPISEFRSMGLLGAIFLLYITSFEPDLIKELYSLSTQDEYQFPLCMALLHLSKVVVDVFKSGKMNKYCNRSLFDLEDRTEESRLTIIGDNMFSFYVFLAEHFLHLWNNRKITEENFHMGFEAHIETKTAHLVRQWINEQRRRSKRRRKHSMTDEEASLARRSAQYKVSLLHITPDSS